MGGNQSVRATHFQRPPPPAEEPDEEVDEHRISISNKMVERLVEDATLAGGAAAAVNNATHAAHAARGDQKDKLYIEKLKVLDEYHSERIGLSVEELNNVVARIDLRTANMMSTEPVCADCRERLIQCYSQDHAGDTIRCWDTVGEFTKCVQEAAAARLQARTEKEAREHARRSRHVAHAREHALKDLGPPSA